MSKPAQTTLPAVIPPTEKDDFDWSGDSVTLHEQPATAVYFDKSGRLVIRQRNWPEDDTFIYIANDSVETFLDKLCDVCGVFSAGLS
jgi:hypothetical protein